VRQDHRFEVRRTRLGRQLRRQPVGQVARGSADALAHRRGVGPGPEHHLVVIGLEHEHVRPAQQAPDRRGGAPQVPRHHDPAPLRIGHGHGDGLARVMGGARRLDDERAEPQRLPGPRQDLDVHAAAGHGGQRARRTQQGTPGPRGEHRGPAGVIAVLVREHDAGQRLEDEARRLRAPFQRPRTESGVHQQRHAGGAQRHRVAPAARPQHRDLHAPVPTR